MLELPTEVRQFLADVLGTFEQDVVEAFLLGSAATGGFDLETSDLDVVVVVDAPIEDRSTLVERLRTLKPPGRDLELVVYRAGSQPPDFELNFSDGAERPNEPEFWFVVDAALAEGHALPLLHGRRWTDLFQAVSPDAIRGAVQDSLAWSTRQPGDDAFARVNAIRARHYLEHGDWLSKADAREPGSRKR